MGKEGRSLDSLGFCVGDLDVDYCRSGYDELTVRLTGEDGSTV